MIFGYHYGSVEDIELLWTLIALIGLGFSVVNLKTSIGDLRFLKGKKISNGRLAVAQVNMYTEASRTAIQAIFLGVGIIALMLPAPPAAALSPLQLAISVGIRWGFLVASFLLTFNTALSRNLRKTLMEDH